MTRVLKALAVSLSLAGLTACSGLDADSTCDRQCLLTIGEIYLAALAANEPDLAPLASDIRFVENVSRLSIGEGLWASTAAVSSGFRVFIPDESQSTIGMIVLIDRQTPDGEVPELVAVRLQLDRGVITEAEHLVGELQPAVDPADLDTPRRNLVATVAESQRMARADLRAIAHAYYTGLVESDASNVPFADDCERQENGLITSSWNLLPAGFESVDVNGNSPPAVARDCIGQMNSARFAYIDSIDNRRVFAADPVQGLVMGLSHFRQSMSRGPLEMIAADGTRVMWEERREPYDLPAAHIFKITDGEIHEIEALGIFVPYMSGTGWE